LKRERRKKKPSFDWFHVLWSMLFFLKWGKNLSTITTAGNSQIKNTRMFFLFAFFYKPNSPISEKIKLPKQLTLLFFVVDKKRQNSNNNKHTYIRIQRRGTKVFCVYRRLFLNASFSFNLERKVFFWVFRI
jgi:hypothetical protein